MTARVGILPQALGGDPSELRRFLALAADAGVDHVAVGDHVSLWVGAARTTPKWCWSGQQRHPQAADDAAVGPPPGRGLAPRPSGQRRGPDGRWHFRAQFRATIYTSDVGTVRYQWGRAGATSGST